ncbi:MAG: PQQ-like beta-propeller repeat protein [Candidatus Hydrogenedentes bacterium]|nr:PQQ-like beta-propeller repeat protein [Candidatus Hydrogenedentota bacterium]
MKHLLNLSLALAGLIACPLALADDSPQFRGPNRDGKYPEKGLLQAWPEGGPKLLWTADGIGLGYSSVSVAGDSIYVTGRGEDNIGRFYALGLDGAIKWSLEYGPETASGQGPAARSTPTIDGDRAYILSGPGLAMCIDLTKKAPLWSVNIVEEFKSLPTEWSLAESPLIDGNKVFYTPGGPDASVVALDKMTGDTIWTSKGLSEAAAYCTPNLIEHGGRRMVVTMTAKSVVALDPETGAILWTHEHPTKYDIHAVTPVYADGMIYYTAGYKSGGGMLQLASDGGSVTPKWSDMTLDCQHHGVVIVDGYVFGTSQTGKELVCLELATGKVMWETREVTQGNVVFADGMLYTYEGPQAGVVSLVKPSPAGFERAGQFTITEGAAEHWAHPTIANGVLYIRHGEKLFAYDVKAG